MKDTEIKIFINDNDLLYTKEYIEWLNLPVSDPELWIGDIKKMTIKEKLDELKTSRKWTNEDLAIKLDVSLNTVKSWNRTTNPRNPNKWIMKELNKLFRTAGIDAILPSKAEVDDLLNTKVFEETAENIIDKEGF